MLIIDLDCTNQPKLALMSVLIERVCRIHLKHTVEVLTQVDYAEHRLGLPLEARENYSDQFVTFHRFTFQV